MEKNVNSTTDSDSMGVCEKIFSAITVSPAFRTIRRIRHYPRESASAVSPATSRDPSPLPTNNHINAPQHKKSADVPVVIRIPITSEKIVRPAAAPTPNQHAQKITKVTKVGQGQVDQGSPVPKADISMAQSPQKVVVGKGHDHQAIAQVANSTEPAKPTHVLVLQKNHKPKEDLAQEAKPKYSESPVKGAVGEGQNNAAVKVEAQVLQVKNEGNTPGGLDVNDKFSEYINRVKVKIRTMSSKNISDSDDDAKKKEKDHHISDYTHRAKNKFKSTPSGAGKVASFKRE